MDSFKADVNLFLYNQLKQLSLDPEDKEVQSLLLKLFKDKMDEVIYEQCHSFGVPVMEEEQEDEPEEEVVYPPIPNKYERRLEYNQDQRQLRGRSCGVCGVNINDRPKNHILCLRCYHR